MAELAPRELSARIAELERQIAELRARIAALERLMGAAGAHPADKETVREKVTYDWQA
jgi:prefoldin subunit 5